MKSSAADTALDGCYVIKATMSATVMNKEQVVARYKSLSHGVAKPRASPA